MAKVHISDMALFTGLKHLCTFIIIPPIYHLLPNVWKASYTISPSIFVDVPYWPPYSTDKFISCVVPGPSQWVFYFGEEIVIAWTHEKTTTLGGTEPHHGNAGSHTAAAVTGLLRSSSASRTTETSGLERPAAPATIDRTSQMSWA